MDRILFSSKTPQWSWLSNFHMAPVTDANGTIWPSTEHWYQAMKSSNPGEQDMIRLCRTPFDAKKLSHKIRNPVPERDTLDIMRTITRSKYNQWPGLAERLVSTGDAELIHDAPWGDTFWGQCNGTGENWQGRIIMEIRDELRKDTYNQEDVMNRTMQDFVEEAEGYHPMNDVSDYQLLIQASADADAADDLVDEYTEVLLAEYHTGSRITYKKGDVLRSSLPGRVIFINCGGWMNGVTAKTAKERYPGLDTRIQDVSRSLQLTPGTVLTWDSPEGRLYLLVTKDDSRGDSHPDWLRAGFINLNIALHRDNIASVAIPMQYEGIPDWVVKNLIEDGFEGTGLTVEVYSL